MTWLFTQVWLWSFAGFLCGAALTWLLFVRPAHRQLSELRERQRAADREAMSSSTEAEDDLAQEEPDTAVLHLLDEDSSDRMRVEPTDDRPFRVSVAAEKVPDRSPEQEAPFGQPSPQLPDEGRRSWMRVAPGDFGAETFSGERSAAEHARDEREAGDAEWQPVQEARQASGGGSAEDAELRLERNRGTAPGSSRDDTSTRAHPAASSEPPTAPAELAPGAEFSAPNQENTWFAAAEFDMYDTDSVEQRQQESPDVDATPRWNDSGDSGERTGPAENEQTDVLSLPERKESEGELTGRLRSLFEPLATPGIEPDRREAELPPNAPAEGDESPGEAEPSSGGAEGATGGPEHEDAARTAGEPDAAQDAEELPRRVPGNTSRPGTPPNARPVMRGRVLDSADDATVTFPAPGERRSQEPAGGDTGESGGRPQEWYPDEQLPDQERPDESYTVKGQLASRQYHTPESPYFEHVVAEVWFRNAADAEQAGFEAWNRHVSE